MKKLLTIGLVTMYMYTGAQTISKVWVPDNGNGTYKNPVVNADYSDPNAIRVGADYYMLSSSFTHIPGLPILHSKNLVNWKLIGHALKRQPQFDHFSTVQHGGGHIRMQRRMFTNTNDNPHHVMAGTREGVISKLIGIAARKSIQLNRPVKISELTYLLPMANRF